MALLVSTVALSVQAVAHECHTTTPVGSVQGNTVTLFQTIVEDWQVVRDRIAERGLWVDIEWLDAQASDVKTEMVSLRRTAQIEQRVVDRTGQQWDILWQLADHHGDCTEVRAEISWTQDDVSIPTGFEWWAPVQQNILRPD
ncbi:hypothetical protein NFC81_12550 [Salinispirillum sp. LH 10-3-1]|uniref:Uncharacterized protein n=1 Tax=Salinispirillum sp. LH 10-3-1 TaxID=2952525 RepID=A0AB38YE00_9GAMM